MIIGASVLLGGPGTSTDITSLAPLPPILSWATCLQVATSPTRCVHRRMAWSDTGSRLHTFEWELDMQGRGILTLGWIALPLFQLALRTHNGETRAGTCSLSPSAIACANFCGCTAFINVQGSTPTPVFSCWLWESRALSSRAGADDNRHHVCFFPKLMFFVV